MPPGTPPTDSTLVSGQGNITTGSAFGGNSSTYLSGQGAIATSASFAANPTLRAQVGQITSQSTWAALPHVVYAGKGQTNCASNWVGRSTGGPASGSALVTHSAFGGNGSRFVFGVGTIPAGGSFIGKGSPYRTAKGAVSCASSFLGHPRVNPVCEDAQYWAEHVPSQMGAGTTVTVSITMRNVGSCPWQAAFDLASCANGDSGLWTLQYVADPNGGADILELVPSGTATWGIYGVATGEVVATGAYKTFTFTITAPSVAGRYQFQWRMRDSLGYMFGDFTPLVTIDVLPWKLGQGTIAGHGAFVGHPDSHAYGQGGIHSATAFVANSHGIWTNKGAINAASTWRGNPSGTNLGHGAIAAASAWVGNGTRDARGHGAISATSTWAGVGHQYPVGKGGIYARSSWVAKGSHTANAKGAITPTSSWFGHGRKNGEVQAAIHTGSALTGNGTRVVRGTGTFGMHALFQTGETTRQRLQGAILCASTWGANSTQYKATKGAIVSVTQFRDARHNLGAISAASAWSGTLRAIKLAQGSIASSTAFSAGGAKAKFGQGSIRTNSAFIGKATGGTDYDNYLEVVFERRLGIIVRRH